MLYHRIVERKHLKYFVLFFHGNNSTCQDTRTVQEQHEETEEQGSSIFRKLYGYDMHSNYNQYNKRKKGLLEEIPSIRYEKGMIMIRETDFEKVKSLIDSRTKIVIHLPHHLS
ncbi:TVG0147974 [Thermoplasma volcanium GSS1]|uniref:TVG0147974 protein n=1 Tax=Thermoplasma volcanium (strain ATCC 51530 / DSM 4299 / JCM 9571 / NBRC 15438 / GSS1) TaxID=273116 RepID=Q97CG0_THEVO|nr:TVG0147974 [Thermoplasma volcanium GSS1]